MIDPIKTLINKTNELEDFISDFNNSNSETIYQNNFACFSKGLINLSFLNSNKMLIAKFETTQNKPLYFQNQVELNIPTSQTIKITLIINNIAIFRTTRKLEAGYNQFTIMKGYIPLISEQVEMYLQITSEEDSLLTIISNTLLVWGINNIKNNLDYQIIETNENYLLSYLNNNTLYYSYQPKDEIVLNAEDFLYHSIAKSYSFSYFKNENNLYLFKVDIDGNLFYVNMNDNNENFIKSNISHVSTYSNSDIILISIVSNNKVYVAEFDTNENISEFKEIESNNFIIVKSYVYFNEFNNKFYIILTDTNNSNYLISNLDNITTESHYINANYSISYSTYEVN